ncbi:ThiF family adenylyltransferase [Flavobacterium plurextorum]|uniref:ThiF family adenylyltransferase n=1 Tax=Flavobacterium TaxID=237 RepID=UPI00214D510A|nr:MULTISPECIES: ThiF family adenylyltransferase [Flavobacterium]UUW08674.1 ThiF family adenylyltransferase [Flavobacterium plurextorum]
MRNETFKYPDTNSSRAGIGALNTKFEDMKIAIIGVGGTGSYILDLVAKTHVDEIHLYDGDIFQVHNAFRAPGACSEDIFDPNGNLTKVKYYTDIYSRMRNGVIAHPVNIDEANISELDNYDFVFISVDSNKVRSFITRQLVKLKIPFIDVGMGINQVGDQLLGTVRVTAGTPENNKHLNYRIGTEEVAENKYASNIQIVDLNCLNAALAVLRWKKMIGFYQDLKKEHNNLYFINTGKLLNEDLT